MGFFPKTPKPKKDREEFGEGKKGTVICKKCEAVYYHKSWHHKIEEHENFKPSKNLRFSLCPACKMIEGNSYEGEIIIENTPEKIKTELKNLVENFGKRAWEKDPMDRIISVKEKQNDFIVLTTENQLAQRLSKKINEVFGKNKEIKISHSDEEDVIRVKIVFEK